MRIATFISGFVVGVAVSSFVPITPLVGVFFSLLGCLLILACKFVDRAAAAATFLVALALIGFGSGNIRYAAKNFHEPTPIDAAVGRAADLTGTIVSEPEIRDTDNRFVLESQGGRILVSAPLFSNLSYGDEVEVQGKLERPGVIASGTGDFDYAAYLSVEGVYETMSFAHVRVISSGHAHRVIAALLMVKQAVDRRIESILPAPESNLLEGLLVAGKQALPQSVQNDFQQAGVIHIVVLSGYNVTVIAEFFLVLLGLFSLSLRKRAVCAGFGIVFFVLMAGATASVVRAGIMAVVLLVGKVLQRRASAPRLLLLTAALMLVWNPKLLVFDPSFQLTFLAMLALIYVEPLVRTMLARPASAAHGQASGHSLQIPAWLAELLATTIATQLTVLPYLLYSVGSVSLVSLISNVLILGIVPFTMLVGFIAALLAFLSSVLAWPFAFVAHLCLAWILAVAHLLGNWRFASIKISHFSGWLTLMCYTLLLVIVWRVRSSPRPLSN